MSQCESVYYGQEKPWRCKHQKGHEGIHNKGEYCSWTDEDAEEMLKYQFVKELGGKLT